MTDRLLVREIDDDSARCTRSTGAAVLAILIALWALTLTAAAIHLAWMSAPEPLVGATFIGLAG